MTDTAISTDVTTATAVFNLGTVGMLCTKQGLNVLSAGLTGERILFTRLAIGDGILEVESDAEYRAKVLDMSEMINFRMTLPIVENVNQGDGTMLLHAIKPNAEVSEGFFSREQAVFAMDQTTGEEILYAYRNSGDTSSFIPSNTGPVEKVIDLGIVTVIQNAKNVDAVLDASFAYVSMADYKIHVDSEHPHLNTPNHYANVTATNKFWVTDEDNHLHQMSAENVRQVILGNEAAEISSLGRTITDTQDKVDALKIFSDAKNELGLDANVLLVEDFNPMTEIDALKVKVLSCAQNGRLIGVETDDGIILGQNYWISDGFSQELVKVTGVTYSTDYYHVQLAEGLTYGYNAETTYLYRTTITATTQVADKKEITWSPSTSFKGIQANIGREIIFNTSQSNKLALQIEGDGIVTRDGYFTLTNSEGSFVYSDTPTDELEYLSEEEIRRLFEEVTTG